jgi:hypothetical protein
MFATVMYSDDVRMPEACGEVSLTKEPLAVFVVGGEVGWQDFQRVQPGKAGMLDEINLSHSARAEQALHGVPRELLAIV